MRKICTFFLEIVSNKTIRTIPFFQSGESSKYDQAKYILEKNTLEVKIAQSKREDFPQEAKRPKYSKLG